jgi:hypothetical protein
MFRPLILPVIFALLHSGLPDDPTNVGDVGNTPTRTACSPGHPGKPIDLQGPSA